MFFSNQIYSLKLKNGMFSYAFVLLMIYAFSYNTNGHGMNNNAKIDKHTQDNIQQSEILQEINLDDVIVNDSLQFNKSTEKIIQTLLLEINKDRHSYNATMKKPFLSTVGIFFISKLNTVKSWNWFVVNSIKRMNFSSNFINRILGITAIRGYNSNYTIATGFSQKYWKNVSFDGDQAKNTESVDYSICENVDGWLHEIVPTIFDNGDIEKTIPPKVLILGLSPSQVGLPINKDSTISLCMKEHEELVYKKMFLEITKIIKQWLLIDQGNKDVIGILYFPISADVEKNKERAGFFHALLCEIKIKRKQDGGIVVACSYFDPLLSYTEFIKKIGTLTYCTKEQRIKFETILRNELFFDINNIEWQSKGVYYLGVQGPFNRDCGRYQLIALLASLSGLSVETIPADIFWRGLAKLLESENQAL